MDQLRVYNTNNTINQTQEHNQEYNQEENTSSSYSDSSEDFSSFSYDRSNNMFVHKKSSDGSPVLGKSQLKDCKTISSFKKRTPDMNSKSTINRLNTNDIPTMNYIPLSVSDSDDMDTDSNNKHYLVLLVLILIPISFIFLNPVNSVSISEKTSEVATVDWWTQYVHDCCVGSYRA